MNSGTTGNLIDMRFTTDSIGYALSDSGIVIKTLDKGNNWNIVASLQGTFTSLCTIGKDTIWAGGNNIYRSVDGGMTWAHLITLAFTSTDMDFFNARDGIIIKPDSGVCHYFNDVYYDSYASLITSDSGYTWPLITDYGYRPYSRIKILNDSTAYVNGTYYSFFEHCTYIDANIGSTSYNKGLTWTVQFYNNFYFSLYSYSSTNVNYLIGLISFANSPEGLYRILSGTSYFVDTLPFQVKDIEFVNDFTGYILTGNDIYETNTGGIVLKPDSNPQGQLNILYYAGNNETFAIGPNGFIIKKHFSNQAPDSIAIMNVSQSQINFDSVMVGGYNQSDLTISNQGTVPLDIVVEAPSYFVTSFTDSSYQSIQTFTLQPFHDTTVYIRFIPTDTSSYFDTLLISSNLTPTKRVIVTGFGTENLAGIFQSDTNLCGDTLLLVGDLTVPSKVKVTICPGTTVLASDFRKILVNGTLIANGWPNDTIIFTSLNSNTNFEGIHFESSGNTDTSIINVCRIQNSRNGGISFKNFSNVIVEHSEISNNSEYSWHKGGALTIENASPIIRFNSFHDNTNGQAHCASALFISKSSSLIFNNIIYNNKFVANYGTGCAITISESDTSLSIIQNLVFNNAGSTNGGAICITDGSSPRIINNTICNNSTLGSGAGIYCESDSNLLCQPLIQNNIIYNNYPDQIGYTLQQMPSASYCDISGGYSNGIGNIDLNPLFVQPTMQIGYDPTIQSYNWNIGSNTPCMNAGNPSPIQDVPSTDFIGNPRIYMNYRIDIGAYEFQGGPYSVNEEELAFVSISPNPFHNSLKISIDNNDKYDFTIFDVTMRKVFQQTISKESIINTENFSKGIFIYQMIKNNEIKDVGKIIKQ